MSDATDKPSLRAYPTPDIGPGEELTMRQFSDRLISGDAQPPISGAMLQENCRNKVFGVFAEAHAPRLPKAHMKMVRRCRVLILL